MLNFSSLFCRVKGGLRAGRAYCRFYNPHSVIRIPQLSGFGRGHNIVNQPSG